MPALAEAAKLGAKAAKAGFDWPHWRDLLPKLAEETAELEAEAAAAETSDDPARKPRSKRSWAICFSPSSILAGTSASMRRWRCAAAICVSASASSRWKWIPQSPLEELAPEELEALWAEAKRKLAESSVRITERRPMILIRACSGHDELEACVQLQIETWGYDDSDVIPRKAFLVAQKIGGQVIGAFDTDLPGAGAEGNARIAGWFRHVFAGSEDRKESKTAIRSPICTRTCWRCATHYRNRGLGAQLKLEQRREALSRGIRHMEWTFDPLEIKNAFLNIHKLGAIVRSYRVNFYGVSSSRLQGGLPTDRLVAEWYLDSDRVSRRFLNGRPAVAHDIEERILVPASIYEWKASDSGREQALAVQLENRQKFQEAFSQGLAVVSALPGMRKETESSNWAAGPNRSESESVSESDIEVPTSS